MRPGKSKWKIVYLIITVLLIIGLNLCLTMANKYINESREQDIIAESEGAGESGDLVFFGEVISITAPIDSEFPPYEGAMGSIRIGEISDTGSYTMTLENDEGIMGFVVDKYTFSTATDRFGNAANEIKVGSKVAVSYNITSDSTYAKEIKYNSGHGSAINDVMPFVIWFAVPNVILIVVSGIFGGISKAKGKTKKTEITAVE